MDKIDVLGNRPDRWDVFSKELLSETDDAELNEIVKQAAKELSSPMALVSLVLDQIQFFKAFVGLPPTLEAARGTHRDASFCQFVVRNGKYFEVNDAPNDTRIPQHVVKEYNVQAYLGVPIMVDSTVVGSLCVLDTKKRSFSDDERNSLHKLAKNVNKRLQAISSSRRHNRLDLTEPIFQPGLTEMSESLKPIFHSVNGGYSNAASVRLFLNLIQNEMIKGIQLSAETMSAYEAAVQANRLYQDSLCDIELAASDCADTLNALKRLTLNVGTSRLSEVVMAAQDLSRHATNEVGGFSLPDFDEDPVIYTKGSLAIAVVSNCLVSIADALKGTSASDGIQLSLNGNNKLARLTFSAQNLSEQAAYETTRRITDCLGIHQPTISAESEGSQVRLAFKIQSA